MDALEEGYGEERTWMPSRRDMPSRRVMPSCLGNQECAAALVYLERVDSFLLASKRSGQDMSG